jgi:DNA-binding cell septation regulator SpoVG
MCNKKGLKITKVTVFPKANHTGNPPLLALVRLVLNDCLIINGIKIYQGKEKKYVRFPTEGRGDMNNDYDIVFPYTPECREYFETEILKAYGRVK